MKAILIGNGINIQFGGADYTNANIIKRALNNLKRGNFPSQIYPAEVGEWLIRLHHEIRDVLAGGYDPYVWTETDKKSLSDFKLRYKDAKQPVLIHDVGFEDYFFVHVLVCYKHRIDNPEKFYAKEGLRSLFLDSIYNSGNISTIYKSFPKGLSKYLLDFDHVFTTNYDDNIARFTGQKVNYLHGAFHVLDDVHNPDSLRNKMPDNPAKDTTILPGYEHLYSNALTTFSGEMKKLSLDTHKHANAGLEKLLKVVSQNPKLARDIESLMPSDNPVVIGFCDAIKAKRENPDAVFSEYYPMPAFSEISEDLHVVGFSPHNDSHIFEVINGNEKLHRVRYYFFDSNEAQQARRVLRGERIELADVKELWKTLLA